MACNCDQGESCSVALTIPGPTKCPVEWGPVGDSDPAGDGGVVDNDGVGGGVGGMSEKDAFNEDRMRMCQ